MRSRKTSSKTYFEQKHDVKMPKKYSIDSPLRYCASFVFRSAGTAWVMAVPALHVIALDARFPNAVLNVIPVWRVRWATEDALQQLDYFLGLGVQRVPHAVLGLLALCMVLVERGISRRWLEADGTMRYHIQSLADLQAFVRFYHADAGLCPI